MRLLCTCTRTFVRAIICFTVIAAIPGSLAAQTPNVAIQSWNPPTSVLSPYVNMLEISTVPPGASPDYFTAGPEFTTDKSQLAFYVGFDNNSLAVIPDGAVTVTVSYAAAAANIAPASVMAAKSALSATDWKDFGQYTMSLVFPPDAPPGYGLTAGFYPTTHELSDPSRYRVVCTTDCSTPFPTSFFLRVTLSCTGETDTSDNEAISYYDQGIPPSDVVILHDVSGSMGSSIALAQQRAKMFVDLLNIGDRVGVVAFSGDLPAGTELTKSLGAAIAGLDASDSAKLSAKTGIDSFSTGGMTPMGEGVLKAQEVLNDLSASPYASTRAIIMLTDGKENWGTHRLQDPPSYPIITGTNGLNNDANGAIGLYPLWFGTLSNWGLSLLQNIDTHTTLGKVVDQPTNDLKLAEAYLMIRGILTSDDVYGIYQGTTGDGYEGVLHVDPITNELIIAAAWRSFERKLHVEVQPPSGGWTPAESVGGVTSRDKAYVVHRIANPEPGKWRYRLVKEDEGEEYVLSALADQVDVLMQSALEKASIMAGEPLAIRARLSRRGKGVPGALVVATVKIPNISLGSLLNDVRDKLDVPLDPKLPVDVPRAAMIQKQVSKIVGSGQIFKYNDARVVLKDTGDGTYIGKWGDTRVAGVYDVTIIAESPSGDLRREHRHSAVVSLGKIDVDRSLVKVEAVEGSSNKELTAWRITVIPTDVMGNYANPGYADRISIEAKGGRWKTPVLDNDDGTYSRILMLPRKDKAKIRVKAFGTELASAVFPPNRLKTDPRQTDSIPTQTEQPLTKQED